MDESRPPVPPVDVQLPSASERTSGDFDPVPMAPAKADESSAAALQRRSEQVEPCRADLADGSSVAIYYRDELEIRDGFLIALRAMGLADAERPSDPATPPVGRAKP
ncbi:hypothetical protein IVB38_28445 [Bradyrhizobium sp. 38]|uniref:hypothetical protein n=1 Tax=unclassified Bradyrhizobium TaxID=2631580 RepID=UPI001FF71E12|nr:MULTISPECIES: hypothetical protein [unclassified Bradyrhizobium]MCK1339824.1 hypothetical protein [Bradyrhizobium sp. 38]MCK1782755.1 hypothetical protein [Bradyrhizobium sp. 132]